MANVISHKLQLKNYFDGIGFDRWSAIYGEGELSPIRRTVREGHELMLAQAESWLLESCTAGRLLDAGCGTGLFSVRMAQLGFNVTAVDIAPRMVDAARDNAQQAGVTERIALITGDIESVPGRYDAVACFDVMVHYPREAFAQLCTFLAERCDGPLLFTYAPYNHLLAFLHWVGGHFPQGNRRQEIQMIPDDVVVGALAKAGMSVKRTTSISHGFYHVKLLEAMRTSDAGSD